MVRLEKEIKWAGIHSRFIVLSTFRTKRDLSLFWKLEIDLNLASSHVVIFDISLSDSVRTQNKFLCLYLKDYLAGSSIHESGSLFMAAD